MYTQYLMNSTILANWTSPDGVNQTTKKYTYFYANLISIDNLMGIITNPDHFYFNNFIYNNRVVLYNSFNKTFVNTQNISYLRISEIEKNIEFQLYLVLIMSFLFIAVLSIFFVQVILKKEQILILFSTFQADRIQAMIDNIVKFSLTFPWQKNSLFNANSIKLKE